MAEERVQKILAKAGIASRRKAEEIITEGLVTINGKVANLGDKATLGKDAIKVRGKLLQGAEAPIYLAFYKPKGVISMLVDTENRPNLSDYLNKVQQRVFPIGRLDFTSEGLILLTNDGDFAEKITKRDDIPRVYRVKVKGHLTEEMVRRIERGAKIDHKLIKPHSVRVARELDKKSQVDIVMMGSGAVDIKAMLEAKGFLVDKLTRMAIGHLTLKGLVPGHYRLLKKSQAEALLEKPELGLERYDREIEAEKPKGQRNFHTKKTDEWEGGADEGADLSEESDEDSDLIENEGEIVDGGEKIRMPKVDATAPRIRPAPKASGPSPVKPRTDGGEQPRITHGDESERSAFRSRSPRRDGESPRFGGGGDRPRFGGAGADRGPRRDGDRPRFGGGDRPRFGAGADRGPRRDGDRPSFGDRPRFNSGDKPRFGGGADRGPRRDGDRPAFGGDKPRFGAGGDKPRFGADRGAPRRDGDRPSYGSGKPRFGGGDKPRFGSVDRGPRRDGDRPAFGGGGDKPRFGAGADRGPRRDGDRPSYGSDKPRFGGGDKPRFGAGGDKPRFGGGADRGPRPGGQSYGRPNESRGFSKGPRTERDDIGLGRKPAGERDRDSSPSRAPRGPRPFGKTGSRPPRR